VDPVRAAARRPALIRLVVLSGMVLCAAAARLAPHPPNFTPVGAMAVFAGACVADRRLALGLPLAALFLSDLALGLHVDRRDRSGPGGRRVHRAPTL